MLESWTQPLTVILIQFLYRYILIQFLYCNSDSVLMQIYCYTDSVLILTAKCYVGWKVQLLYSCLGSKAVVLHTAVSWAICLVCFS